MAKGHMLMQVTRAIQSKAISNLMGPVIYVTILPSGDMGLPLAGWAGGQLALKIHHLSPNKILLNVTWGQTASVSNHCSRPISLVKFFQKKRNNIYLWDRLMPKTSGGQIMKAVHEPEDSCARSQWFVITETHLKWKIPTHHRHLPSCSTCDG